MRIKYENTYEKGYIAILPSIYIRYKYGFQLYFEFLFWGIFINQ